jgi:hypothetical protein
MKAAAMTHDGDDETPYWTEEQLKRRRQRSLAIAWVLGALVTLFFVITIAKLGGNVAKRPAFGAVDAVELVR